MEFSYGFKLKMIRPFVFLAFPEPNSFYTVPIDLDTHDGVEWKALIPEYVKPSKKAK